MARFDLMDLHHPQPWDIVDDPVQLAGVAGAFEAVIGTATLNDADGNPLASVALTGVGGNGYTNFTATMPVGSVPGDARCDLVLVFSQNGEGEVPEPLHVPVLFGPAVLPGYTSYSAHDVAPGDTLSGLAVRYYDDETRWPSIFAANRDVIADPDLIFPGQRLRIPFA